MEDYEEDINMESKEENDNNNGIPFIPEKGFYQPSTDESWEAYQALISMVEDQLGGFPRHVICGAADEVLSVLKSTILFGSGSGSGSRAKKIEIERLLGPISEFTFDQLLMIGNLINDYHNRHDQEEGLLIYKPRSEKTWMAYNLFLDVIAQIVGVQDQTVLRLGVDGILSVLKNDEIEKVEWKKEAVELQLGPITDHTFEHLSFIGTLITDYSYPPTPQPPPQAQPQDLPSSSRGYGNSWVEPTPEFIKEEKKKLNFDGSPMKFWIDGDDDDDDDDNEMIGQVSDPTVENDGDDASSDMAMTDETGSGEFTFEKVEEVNDDKVVQKSDVDDADWVVVAFESWRGFNNDDDDDDIDDMER